MSPAEKRLASSIIGLVVWGLGAWLIFEWYQWADRGRGFFFFANQIVAFVVAFMWFAAFLPISRFICENFFHGDFDD